MGVVESYLNFLTLLSVSNEDKAAYKKLFEMDMSPVLQVKDVAEYLNQLGLPVVEVGGPTPLGFQTINANDLETFFTSNIASRGQKADQNSKTGGWQDFVGSSGEIDFQADGRYLPFSTNSIGGVLISAMINDEDLNRQIIEEADRVLAKDGLLILEANKPQDVVYALENGFKPAKWRRTLNHLLQPYFNIILIKPN